MIWDNPDWKRFLSLRTKKGVELEGRVVDRQTILLL